MNRSNLIPAFCASLTLTLICCASTNALLKPQDEQSSGQTPLTAGSTLKGGAVEVLAIKRWNDLAIVRMQNTTRKPIEFEYRPRFLHKTGVEVRTGVVVWQKASLGANADTNLDVPIPYSIKEVTDAIAIDVREIRR